MAHTGIHEKIKIGLWTKCVETVTKLQNVMVNPHAEKFAHEKLYGKMTDNKKSLSNLG